MFKDLLRRLGVGSSEGFRRIQLEYEIYPRPRPLRTGRGAERLQKQLQASIPAARELVREIARFQPQFKAIPVQRQPNADLAEPNWLNGWFPSFDAMTLYGLLVTRNPRHYVEVGSGNSTRFARRAIRDFGLRTEIISIDPHPRAEIDAICDEVIRTPLEDVDVRRVSGLTSDDLLFVDSSHRSFQNSDVTVFFTEILPELPPGIVYGLHDIFLPLDYPPSWVERFYSEQYLLATYLAGGADGDQVYAPVCYLACETDVFQPLAPFVDSLELPKHERMGSAFWLRRAGKSSSVEPLATRVHSNAIGQRT